MDDPQIGDARLAPFSESGLDVFSRSYNVVQSSRLTCVSADGDPLCGVRKQ